jgi:hypothetical protein
LGWLTSNVKQMFLKNIAFIGCDVLSSLIDKGRFTLISDVSVPYQCSPFSAPVMFEWFRLKYVRWCYCFGHGTDGTDTELTRHWYGTDTALVSVNRPEPVTSGLFSFTFVQYNFGCGSVTLDSQVCSIVTWLLSLNYWSVSEEQKCSTWFHAVNLIGSSVTTTGPIHHWPAGRLLQRLQQTGQQIDQPACWRSCYAARHVTIACACLPVTGSTSPLFIRYEAAAPFSPHYFCIGV